MSNRQCGPTSGCDIPPDERLYPVCRIGLIVFIIGLVLVFISLVLGFWLAFLGAILILIGYLVITNC